MEDLSDALKDEQKISETLADEVSAESAALASLRERICAMIQAWDGSLMTSREFSAGLKRAVDYRPIGSK